MKYKLINKTTKEEHICDKVKIDGFDYYVSNEQVFENGVYAQCSFAGYISKTRNGQISYKVIATNKTSIDLPQVIDEVEILADQLGYNAHNCHGFIEGYNKSQETHPNSDSDMIEYGIWVINNRNKFSNDVLAQKGGKYLEIWKSQQIKTIFYDAKT